MELRCERPYCQQQATISASRVDAIRDHWYLCDAHRIPEPTIFEQSPLPKPLDELADQRPPRFGLETVLSFFPPKHRQVTRREAAAIVAAHVEGRKVTA